VRCLKSVAERISSRKVLIITDEKEKEYILKKSLDTILRAFDADIIDREELDFQLPAALDGFIGVSSRMLEEKQRVALQFGGVDIIEGYKYDPSTYEGLLLHSENPRDVYAEFRQGWMEVAKMRNLTWSEVGARVGTIRDVVRTRVRPGLLVNNSLSVGSYMPQLEGFQLLLRYLALCVSGMASGPKELVPEDLNRRRKPKITIEPRKGGEIHFRLGVGESTFAIGSALYSTSCIYIRRGFFRTGVEIAESVLQHCDGRDVTWPDGTVVSWLNAGSNTSNNLMDLIVRSTTQYRVGQYYIFNFPCDVPGVDVDMRTRNYTYQSVRRGCTLETKVCYNGVEQCFTDQLVKMRDCRGIGGIPQSRLLFECQSETTGVVSRFNRHCYPTMLGWCAVTNLYSRVNEIDYTNAYYMLVRVVGRAVQRQLPMPFARYVVRRNALRNVNGRIYSLADELDGEYAGVRLAISGHAFSLAALDASIGVPLSLYLPAKEWNLKTVSGEQANALLLERGHVDNDKLWHNYIEDVLGLLAIGDSLLPMGDIVSKLHELLLKYKVYRDESYLATMRGKYATRFADESQIDQLTQIALSNL
jgi:hypothetical protein